ncbi:major tail protein [Staphylococcus xylosus]
MTKNYHATTGVDGFFYGILNDKELGIAESKPEHVQFLQEITVTSPQEFVKAYGDNEVAEMAVSNAPVEVSGQFHKIPTEDKKRILGLKNLEKDNPLYGFGSDDVPPYIAVVFCKTHEDGSREWVGLPKGKIKKPEQTAGTKQDSVEFSSDSLTGEFVNRDIEVKEGSTIRRSVLFGADKAGENKAKKAMFKAIFGIDIDKDVDLSKDEEIEEV